LACSTMSSMSFSGGKQFVRPPQRGVFPLDHDSECKQPMQVYILCLKESRDMHHKCRDLSKDYLECRMNRELMAKEDLENMGYSDNAQVKGALEYDKSKEKGGYVAGKHMDAPSKWWFQKGPGKDWTS
jgi:cytochrome c oxidase assembly protein subunit 19